MGNCLPKIRTSRTKLCEAFTPTELEEFMFSVGKMLYAIQRKPGRPPGMRWKVRIPIRRKRYSHKETQTCSHPPSTIKEHFAKKDATNSSELWYSTVSHDVKHEASVINSNNQTEYALVNVPKRKENIASEEHSEYDYVLIT